MKQTTKSLVTTLGVLALAAGIGGAALWVTRDTENKAEQKEKSAKLFDGLDKAKVRQVKLVSGGKLVALATRADASAPWKIAEPVAAEADASTVDAVVSGVADFKQKSELGEADPKQYGLDRPNLVVSVKTEDGKETSVEIGESNPFDSSIYVRKDGEKSASSTSTTPPRSGASRWPGPHRPTPWRRRAPRGGCSRRRRTPRTRPLRIAWRRR